MTRSLRILWWVGGSLVFPGVLIAGGEHSAVSFKLYRGYTIVVTGSIGGLKNLNLLIDTGAVPTVVDRRIARKLRLSGQNERLSLFSQSVPGERVALPSLQIGPRQAGPLSVLVQDLSTIEEGLGTRIDALLGLDALGSRTFSLDYESRELSFGEVGTRGATARFEPGLTYVVVHLEVQGPPLRLLLDTGSKDLILFERTFWDRLPGLRVKGEKISSNMGGQVRLRQVELPGARLGDANLGALSAYVMNTPAGPGVELDGLLGVVSLGAKRVHFDFQQNVVTWK